MARGFQSRMSLASDPIASTPKKIRPRLAGVIPIILFRSLTVIFTLFGIILIRKMVIILIILYF